jgi:hypothetical protein
VERKISLNPNPLPQHNSINLDAFLIDNQREDQEPKPHTEAPESTKKSSEKKNSRSSGSIMNKNRRNSRVTSSDNYSQEEFK